MLANSAEWLVYVEPGRTVQVGLALFLTTLLRLQAVVTPVYGHPADGAWCSHHRQSIGRRKECVADALLLFVRGCRFVLTGAWRRGMGRENLRLRLENPEHKRYSGLVGWGGD